MYEPAFPTALIDCDLSFDILERSIKSVFLGKRDSSCLKFQFPQGSTEISSNLSSPSHNDIDFGSSSPDLQETPTKESSASQICKEIEQSMNKAIKAIGNDLWQSDIKTTKGRSRIATFIIDCNGDKRRLRRKPEDLTNEKTHQCPSFSCQKTYTSKCSLYLHMKRHHPELELVKEGSEVPAAFKSRVKKGVDLFKVFKNMKALDHSQLGSATVRPKSSTFCDDVNYDISMLRKNPKKRLFSGTKFDRNDLISVRAKNVASEASLKMKRFNSMGGEMLWEEFGAKAESYDLDPPSPVTHEAQNEIFSSELSKMRTSDIVQCQYQKIV
jgi:hypothetical protein